MTTQHTAQPRPTPERDHRGHQEHPLVEAARALTPTLRARAAEIEQAGRVPGEIAAELAERGFFRMLVPRSLGGGEVPPQVFIAALSELARGDAATAWCVMTGSTTGLASAYVSEAGGQALWAEQPNAIMAGVFAPMGRATPVSGGYRLSGRWSFASGCDNASWCMLGAVVDAAEQPATKPAEQAASKPTLRSLFVPMSQARIINTWSVSGMRGTGSHDVAVDDVFVPHAHSAELNPGSATVTAPLYRFPLFGLLAHGVSAVAIGVAEAARDAFIEVATRAPKPGRQHRLADRELAQAGLGAADANTAAARALVHHTIAELWAAAHQRDGFGSFDADERARLRLAATKATELAADAVSSLYRLAGSSAIHQSSPLQRHLRDVYVITQHLMVQPALYKSIGKVALGFGAPPDL